MKERRGRNMVMVCRKKYPKENKRTDNFEQEKEKKMTKKKKKMMKKRIERLRKSRRQRS